jgi:hypothetical protein
VYSDILWPGLSSEQVLNPAYILPSSKWDLWVSTGTFAVQPSPPLYCESGGKDPPLPRRQPNVTMLLSSVTLLYLIPVVIILSWLWGPAGGGSTNVRLWLHNAAIPQITLFILHLFHMSVCGGGVVKGSCIVSDRYKIHKQTSPESVGTRSHNLWWC